MSAAAQPPRPGAILPQRGATQGALLRPGAAPRSDEFAGTPSESPTQLAVRRFRSNKIGMVALVGFLTICAMSAAAPWFASSWAGRGPTEQNLSGTIEIDGKQQDVVSMQGLPNVGPGLRREYTFGSDSLGRDVFVRMLYGGSVSLRVGIFATMICIALGTLIGLVGGYFGGRSDKMLMYIVDVMMAFPFTIFMIALSAAIATSGHLGPFKSTSIVLPMFFMGALSSFGFSRIIRSNAKELGAQEYVEAARALGGNDKRILFVHLLPHLVPTIITYSGILLAGMILGEAGLSFLGVGVQQPTPSWGNLISDGRNFYSTAWWISGAGGLMVMLTVLCSNLVGEAMEEAFDPKGSR